MNNLLFQNKAWEDYLYWQSLDKKTIKRINAFRLVYRINNGVIEILSCRGLTISRIL